MASASLSYTLSDEQAAFFNEMVSSALLPKVAIPGQGELVERYKKEQREAQRLKMLPYADLLGGCIVRQLQAKRAELLAQLHTAPWKNMEVPIFSWNTVVFNETLQEMNNRLDGATNEELAKHFQTLGERERIIAESGAEHMFGVAHTAQFFTDVALREVRIDRIFRNSDLATQLVTTLGPNFTYKIRPIYSEACPHYEYGSPYGFSTLKKTLIAVYHPFGMTKSVLLKNLAVFQNHAERAARGEVTRLDVDQWLRGSGNWKAGQPEEMLMPKYEIAPGRWSTVKPATPYEDDDEEESGW